MSRHKTVRTCPVCGRPTVERFRPFCSGRCADVDLANWLDGVYAVPASEPLSLEGLDVEAGEARPEEEPDDPDVN